jgi:hypothetical protein
VNKDRAITGDVIWTLLDTPVSFVHAMVRETDPLDITLLIVDMFLKALMLVESKVDSASVGKI